MADVSLKDHKVAILSTNGFEESELFEPRQALKNAGAEVDIISPEPDEIKGWKSKDWGRSIKVDVVIDKANPDKYDALVLPGGVMNSDKLRTNEMAVQFVRKFVEAGKPIAAICHAPWILIEAEAVKHRKLTSYPSLKTDLQHAGAEWVNEEVVTDQGLVTSRKPEDLPAFIRKMIEEIREGRHPVAA